MAKQFTCRKAAVFSDIHSNYYAFRACYQDALQKGAELFIFLGDYVSDLADPRRTLDLVYEIKEKHPTVCLRGNRERYMLECMRGITSFSKGSKTGSLLYTFHQLRPRDFAFIEALPIYDEIALNGISVEIAHGSATDDRFYFEGIDRNTETVFAQMKYDYFLGGHCHRQYIRQSGEKTICNPGSVGVPREHVCSTQYAMLEVNHREMQFSLCQIPYDIPAMIHRQFESGLVEMAPYWAIGALYDVLTGEEYTMALLERLTGEDVYNEQAWREAAVDLGMCFTEGEILRFFEQVKNRGGKNETIYSARIS